MRPRARGAQTLELTPGNSFAERNRMAVRDLRETLSLWRLCWALAQLDIVQRYRGSLLGPFWLTLSTGVMVGAMGVIYSTLFQIEMHDYLPFLAISQVMWGYLAVLVAESCQGFTMNEGMIRSVRMPFILYGARMVVRNLMVLAHNIVVIVVVDLVLWNWPGPVAVYAIPGFALWLIDSLALTMLLGAVCARFRDVPPIAASVMQMAFFITPVIWRPHLIGDKEWMLPFNPFYTMLEIVRGPLLGTVPDAVVYFSAFLTSMLLCAVTWVFFARVRGRIAFWV